MAGQMAKRAQISLLFLMRLGPMSIIPTETLVTVIGGSGFVGRQVVRSLAKRGYRVRVACRRPDLAGHVLPLGTPGQIALVQANLRYPASVAAACEGAHAVINLPGLLFSTGSQGFSEIHAAGAEVAARAAKAAKASLFIQMSAIGAEKNSAAAYASTKAEGEQRAAAAFPGAMIVRPSIVFGPDDSFFNTFAAMARIAPALPLIGGGATKFQPVFVGDVAEAFATLVDRGVADGKTYELGGPAVASFKDLLQFVLATTQRKRLLLPVPWFAAKLLGTILGFAPKPLLTADQVELLKTDNVVSAAAKAEGRDLAGLGITARSYATIVPTYLYRFRKEGQFTVPNG
jgi:NADH dehydrogenase